VSHFRKIIFAACTAVLTRLERKHAGSLQLCSQSSISVHHEPPQHLTNLFGRWRTAENEVHLWGSGSPQKAFRPYDVLLDHKVSK